MCVELYQRLIVLERIFILPLAPRWVRHSYLSKRLHTIPYTCGLSVDLAHAYTMLWLQTGHHKPLWSFSFWLVISLYALINNVLSLCVIMAIIALLVGRFQSFASLHLYWVWSLIVHPTSKNQTCHLCTPYLPICGI